MRAIARLLRTIGGGARIVAGTGCYDAYLAHMRESHASATPMTELEFFRDRQHARFGGGGSSSCC